MSDPRTISIITNSTPAQPDELVEGRRGTLEDIGENFGLAARSAKTAVANTIKRGTEIPVETLKSQMLKVHGVMTEIFEQFQASEAENPAGLRLEEVELSVEISSQGEVSIVGIGGTELGGTGAITLKFKRPGSGD
ncbi:MAG: hypothetical protein F6J87_01845 [Spirulina sp. SIO3F2]|nr:hypothetical protein [Spirulina sp. SIO3F2]